MKLEKIKKYIQIKNEIKLLEANFEQFKKKIYFYNFEEYFINLKSQIIEIEKFIYNMSNEDIKYLIILKYIQGFTWKMTANKFYGYPCEDRARKKVNRFFMKNCF